MDFIDVLKQARNDQLEKIKGKKKVTKENKSVLQRCELLHKFFSDYAAKNGGKVEVAIEEGLSISKTEFSLTYKSNKPLHFSKNEIATLVAALKGNACISTYPAVSGRILMMIGIDDPLTIAYV